MSNSDSPDAGLTPTPHAFAAYEWLARVDPAFEAERQKLARLTWAPAAPALAVKYREIIAAVILACRASPTIEAHLRRALAEGASLREALEGFQVAAILGGFPALHFALPFLQALHQEFGDSALGAPPPAAAKSAVAQKTTATGPVSRGMREWAFLDKVDPAYDGARRGITALVWTPAAPALPVKIRELVASAVLAYRAFPTLDGHLRRAVREGASVREALEAMEVAALPGGFPLIHYALPFLNALHDDVEGGRFR